MSLTKEQFFAPRPRRVEPVDLPAFGGNVYVRKLTVLEQTRYEAEAGTLDKDDTKGFTAVALAFWLCTEDGSDFITVAEALQHVGSLSAPEVAAIIKAGTAINRGIAPAAVEALAKN